MKTKSKIVKIIVFLMTIVLFAAIYYLDIFKATSNMLNDTLYQRGNLSEGNIVILEIDEHSLEELGPYQTWKRDYVAEAIERLNSEPDLSPTAIGVDILYTGYTNEESDNHLVEAAALSDNVVFGSYINIDNVLSEDSNGTYYLKKDISQYEEPFEELKAVSEVGFVNGFIDSDHVVRHALLTCDISERGEIPSLSYALFKIYAKRNGIEDFHEPYVNEDGFWYIDYTDKPTGYSNSFSLSDYLEGEIDNSYFADSIVLIGPYADAMMDGYVSAIDHSSLMYGVEIHANQLESLIRGEFKKEVPKSYQLLLLIILISVCVILCYFDRLIYNLIGSILIIVGYPVLCVVMYNSGYVLDILYLPVAAACILVFNVASHYFRVSLEKKKVEKTFKRYVAPEIIEKISQTGMDTVKLGGEAVDCAILFVDIRGFTTLSEKLQPEEVVSILNKYLELTSESIFMFGGTLDKYIGDATMAIFGAPLPLEDYVFKAVSAAYNMVVKASDMSEAMRQEFGRTVSFGIGVHCGKAVVGNIGTQRRMDYTAIGDTVNTAARLEANAPADTVYISKNVYDILKDRIEAESIGCLPLKGKHEQLEVYILHGFK